MAPLLSALNGPSSGKAYPQRRTMKYPVNRQIRTIALNIHFSLCSLIKCIFRELRVLNVQIQFLYSQRKAETVEFWP